MAFTNTGIFDIDGGNLQQVFDYDASNHVIYTGWGQAGQATSAAIWRIKKLTYSGDNVTNIQFPSGSPSFSFVWNDRASYTYS